MAVSIEDVARLANVSISTVSRVINGRDVVNEKTRERVRSAIKELGYQPNVFARGLMLRKSHLLGMVLPDLHGEFYSEVIRGANAKAREHGYHLMVSSFVMGDDGNAVLNKVGVGGLLDGVAVMVTDLHARSTETLSHLAGPIVVMDGQGEDDSHDTIQIDQMQGARAMMDHLLAATNIRRIVFVGGGVTNIDTIQRLAAYREALARAGRPVVDDDIYHLDYEYTTAFDFGLDHATSWAEANTCVFAANDEMAAGIVHAATAKGLSVPADLRIVGFDDTRISRLTRPPLTTVRVPMAQMGETAVELLCQRLADPDRPPQHVVLPAEIVVRQSCGCQ
ncbi:MAG: LacI family DNA-binding transcriptional regulator [Pirellulaceae bacterium]|nr:LacI family DNA-binding transcriptional regulator [Planctomycetales bacterium]